MYTGAGTLFPRDRAARMGRSVPPSGRQRSALSGRRQSGLILT
jgi:hypothetical protein